MGPNIIWLQFSSVRSLSCVRFFATPWIEARQASLSITNSRSSLKLTSIESVMPSSHLMSPKGDFPGAPVVMYGCESWTGKKAEHWRIDAFELWCRRRLLGVPWTARRSNQSILKEISPEYSLQGLITEAETLILWLPDVKNWLIGKDSDAGKDWKWEEKGMTEDEMVGWHHWLNGHEFEQAPGVGDGQGGLACYSPWGGKGSDTTERLNWTEHPHSHAYLGETEIGWITAEAVLLKRGRTEGLYHLVIMTDKTKPLSMS